NSSGTCSYQSWSYSSGEKIYQADCLQYLCNNEIWTKTGDQLNECCYNGEMDPVYEAGGVYDIFRQRFLWWYRNINNWYSDLETEWKQYAAANQTVYSPSCLNRTCLSFATWQDTDERNQQCCVHNNKWYYQGQPLYKDDCVGYVCLQGKWTETEFTDPTCCNNPDWVESQNYSDYFWLDDDYKDWWSNYSFGEPERGDGVPDEEWVRINTTRIQSDGMEVMCISRDTWLPTGNGTRSTSGIK
ncbi:hypothetical protein SK128_017453, partial [Halocaridina rubra]